MSLPSHLHGSFDAVPHDSRTQTSQQGSRSFVLNDIQGRLSHTVFVLFWFTLDFRLDDINRRGDAVGECRTGATGNKVTVIQRLQGLEGSLDR